MVDIRQVLIDLAIKLSILSAVSGLSQNDLGQWFAGHKIITDDQGKSLEKWYKDFLKWDPEKKMEVFSPNALYYVCRKVEDTVIENNGNLSQHARERLLDEVNNMMNFHRGDAHRDLTMRQLYGLIAAAKTRIQKRGAMPNQTMEATQSTLPTVSGTPCPIDFSTPLTLDWKPLVAPLKTLKPSRREWANILRSESSTCETEGVEGLERAIRSIREPIEKVYAATYHPMKLGKKLGGVPVLWEQSSCSSSTGTMTEAVEVVTSFRDSALLVGWNDNWCAQEGTDETFKFYSWSYTVLVVLVSKSYLEDNNAQATGKLNFARCVEGLDHNEVNIAKHTVSPSRQISEVLQSMSQGQRCLVQFTCGELCNIVVEKL